MKDKITSLIIIILAAVITSGQTAPINARETTCLRPSAFAEREKGNPLVDFPQRWKFIPQIVRSANLIVHNADTEKDFDTALAISFLDQLKAAGDAQNHIRTRLSKTQLDQVASVLRTPGDDHLADARNLVVELTRQVIYYYYDDYENKKISLGPVAELAAATKTAKGFFDSRLSDSDDRKIALLLYFTMRVSVGNTATSGVRITQNDWNAILDEIARERLLQENEILRIQDVMRRNYRRFTSTIEAYEYVLGTAFPNVRGQRRERIREVLAASYSDMMKKEILGTLESRVWLQLHAACSGGFQTKPLRINKKAVENRFLLSPSAQVFATIEDTFHRAGYESGVLAYPFSGADIATALLCTNADLLRFYDATPFGFDVTIENEEELRTIYQSQKVISGYNVQRLLSIIGIAKAPILWELRALGAENITTTKAKESGIYYVDFDWSYDGVSRPTRRRIEYCEKKFDINAIESAGLLNGATFYMDKGSFNLPLITSGLPPAAVWFRKDLPWTQINNAGINAHFDIIHFQNILSNTLIQMVAFFQKERIKGYGTNAEGVILIRKRPEEKLSAKPASALSRSRNEVKTGILTRSAI